MEIKVIIHQYRKDNQIRLQSKTLTDYIRDIKFFFDYTKKPIDKIQRHDIRKWLNHLSELKYKPNGIYNKFYGLKSFLNYCLEEGLIDKNPIENMPHPKEEAKIPYYLTTKQLAELRTVSKSSLLERAIIEALYATGVRISELLSIKKEDIYWQDRIITIQEGKGKKGRIVPFTKSCADNLQVYLNSRTDDSPYVFAISKNGRPLGYTWVQKKFQFYSNQLGFRVTAHTLRHTCAAHLARQGMPIEAIQKVLGHDDLDNTRVYARLYDHARKDQYDNWM